MTDRIATHPTGDRNYRPCNCGGCNVCFMWLAFGGQYRRPVPVQAVQYEPPVKVEKPEPKPEKPKRKAKAGGPGLFGEHFFELS